MRLLRVADLQESSPGAEAPLSGIRWDSLALPSIAEDQVITQEHLGGPAPASGGEQDEASADSERLDQVAYRHYGNCAYWKLLAAYNGISNPLRLATGFLLRIPNFTRLLEGAE